MRGSRKWSHQPRIPDYIRRRISYGVPDDEVCLVKPRLRKAVVEGKIRARAAELLYDNRPLTLDEQRALGDARWSDCAGDCCRDNLPCNILLSVQDADREFGNASTPSAQ